MRVASKFAMALWIALRARADSAACAPCHREIYESYRRTAMALTSGAVTNTRASDAFTHTASGFSYRVRRDWLEFSKDAVQGRKRLAWYIGSGAVARSYLVEDDGFLFEAPVAYYAAVGRWGLALAYDQYAYPFVTRPIVPACLNCHATAVSWQPGTLNRYANPPFRENGIGCERCHGPGEDHAASGGTIVNPAKLSPDRRDSVCAQCHLSGEVRVTRRAQPYQPGDRLSDSIAVFVRNGVTPAMRVTSHFEKLAQSACKRAARDRMWCGTCHDPHRAPNAAAIRAQCRNCHADTACKETAANRARRRDDCIACHMPKSPVTDAQHVVYTDHSIPRRPRLAEAQQPLDELIAFAGTEASERDLALAYGIVASRQDRTQRLLEAAAKGSPGDTEVLVSLAEIYRANGNYERAIPLYRRAIELDPAQLTAPVGLGGILFERGQFAEAIQLWQNALTKNSGLVLVATNLAMAQWRTGDRLGAEATLRKVIGLSPAFAPARDLLQKLPRE